MNNQKFWKRFSQKRWMPVISIKVDVLSTWLGSEAQAKYFRESSGLSRYLPQGFYIEQKYVDWQYFTREDQVNYLINLIKNKPKVLFSRLINQSYKIYQKLPRQSKLLIKGNISNFSN